VASSGKQALWQPIPSPFCLVLPARKAGANRHGWERGSSRSF